MRPRIHERPAVPTDDEIRTYDSVPVSVAARYLGWQEAAVRLALREGRASFGIAIRGEGGDGLSYKISPGGLIKYKRDGIPCFDYQTLVGIVQRAISASLQREIPARGGSVHMVMQDHEEVDDDDDY